MAIAIDVERNNGYRWVNENRDLTAETVLEIVRSLKKLNPEASQAFVQHYLGDEQ